MENLRKQIDAFYASNDGIKQHMRKLAETFLFGGYINVRDQYHIYPGTVEFYYLEQGESVAGKIELEQHHMLTRK